MTEEVLCYNKCCGKKFDPKNNTAEECVHHPGVPVFHDALKGWSCCKRRTTDFSDFLNIPGCTKGIHSNVKPVEVAPKVTSSKADSEISKNDKLEVYGKTPQPIRNMEPSERPSVAEPMIPLPLKVTPSLQKALQKLSLESSTQSSEADKKQTLICRHKSCTATYGEGIDEVCMYHPGGPVFHEGMKYWTCCQRKTSDFSAWLAQEGCTKGTHEWKVKPLVSTTPCRYDWHQTGSVVVISVFAKMAVGESSSVKVNQVKVEIEISFEGGTRNFALDLELQGVIDPSKSFVTLYGTKVEITLKKGDASHWRGLDIPKPQPELEEDKMEEEEAKEIPEKAEKQITVDDDSDLSGIDDTEFD